MVKTVRMGSLRTSVRKDGHSLLVKAAGAAIQCCSPIALGRSLARIGKIGSNVKFM